MRFTLLIAGILWVRTSVYAAILDIPILVVSPSLVEPLGLPTSLPGFHPAPLYWRRSHSDDHSSKSSSSSTSSTTPSPSSTSPTSTPSPSVSHSTSTHSTSSISSSSTTHLTSSTSSTSTSVATSGPTSTSTPSKSTMSLSHRNLIIILSSVLGTLGLALILVAICLVWRYRRGKSPFNRQGGVTPINDEEIDSWRNTFEQKRPIVAAVTSPHTPRGPSIDSIALQRSPTWNWTPPGHTRNSHSLHSPASFLEQAPDFLARAPNSRVGLTDEAKPGAEPYLPPVKRQSSRLSKAAPGHGRSKSRRSSISAKSVRSQINVPIAEPKPVLDMGSMGRRKESVSRESMPTWYDPDSESVGTALRNDTNSSPEASIFDGLVAGGLSPRPKSRNNQTRQTYEDEMWDKESSIGRAIS